VLCFERGRLTGLDATGLTAAGESAADRKEQRWLTVTEAEERRLALTFAIMLWHLTPRDPELVVDVIRDLHHLGAGSDDETERRWFSLVVEASLAWGPEPARAQLFVTMKDLGIRLPPIPRVPKETAERLSRRRPNSK
jgi:hypothetical protein